MTSPRFSGPTTFNRLPYVPDFEGKDVDVVLLGIPFDGGTSFRPGSRFAPRAVREASVLSRNYHPEMAVHVYERLNVVDGGDVSVNPLNFQKTMASIEAEVTRVRRAGARSICVGGDHSVLLPELRALHRTRKKTARGEKNSEPVLIHFDAHTDTADQAWGEKYHHGTPVRRAIEEGILRGSRVFQIGIRGPLTSKDQESFVRESGIHVLGIDDFHDARKYRAFFSKLKKAAGRSPCFLSFDVDVLDPAYAPGTGTPVVGGMTSFDALRALRGLAGLNIAAADVVEVSPPYDHAQLTSLVGAAVIFEILALMASASD
ncbi:MAG: agmatinase [Bdellovibrionales bacterium GWB1_55_8]|nr:MAG: agmatinase [Bdellovibrionales bacterium GWB1_55_8]